MDADNFLDIKYVSFTGLGWFNDRLKEEGGVALTGAQIIIIKESNTDWVELYK